MSVFKCESTESDCVEISIGKELTRNCSVSASWRREHQAARAETRLASSRQLFFFILLLFPLFIDVEVDPQIDP